MSEDIFDLENKPVDNDNPTKRMPVALVLDTSSSMSNDNKIDELNEGVRALIEELKNNDRARDSVEMSIIRFGGDVKVVETFGEIENMQTPHMSANGGTPMGEAFSLALQMLEKRKKEYRDNGIQYFQPVCVLMTDGHATDSIEQASADSKKLISQDKLIVIPIAIGNGADINQLSSFSNLPPMRITENFSFLEFFKWLSASIGGATGGQDLEKMFEELSN